MDMNGEELFDRDWTIDQEYANKLQELAWLDGSNFVDERRKKRLEDEIVALEGESLSRDDGDDTDRDRTLHFNNAVLQQPTTLTPTTHNHRPHSSSAALPRPLGFSQYVPDFPNGLDGHFASDSLLMEPNRIPITEGAWQAQLPLAMAPPEGEAQQRDQSSFPSPASSPSSSSSASSTSDESSSISRKRRRSDLTLGEDSSNRPYKSRRTSASPSETAGTSPTSLESIPSDLYDLLGGDPKQALREMREEQQAQEKLHQQRQQAIAQDEELALALQREFDEDNDYPQMSSAAGPSSQALIGSDGRLHRPSWLPNSLGETNTPMSAATPAGHPLYQSSPTVKDEMSNHGWRDAVLPQSSYASFQQILQKRTRDSFREPTNVVEISSDSGDDQPSVDTLGLTRTNPISLDNDDFVDLDDVPIYSAGPSATAGLPFYPNNLPLATTAQGLAHGATQLGQTLFDSASGVLGSLQNVFAPGTNGPFAYPSLDAGDFSPAAFASHAFSHYGMDARTNTEAYQQYLDRVNYVTNDPTRSRAEIQSLLENIRPDEDLPPENREGTPEAMTYPLMEHQKMGLAWLKKMELSEQKGGILADAMGLGKTIQALALMVSHRSEDPSCKTTLIVAPVALLRQWEKEIQTKLKPGRHGLKVYTLHGKSRVQSWDRLRTYDVVLTTFGTLSSEHKRLEDAKQKQRENPNWRPTAQSDQPSMLGEHSLFYRIIIDEAQCIKNKNTRAATAAAALQAKSRFCMTGTPMMNHVDELYSLLRFLRITPWNDLHRFNAAFSRPLRNQNPSVKERAMKRLQVLLRAILLRRNKDSKIDGKPILQLPPRSTESVHAIFSEDENLFYQALETRTRLQFNKYLKAGTVGKHYSNILVLLLRLRQACCHPYLLRDFAEKVLSGELSAQDMVSLAKELAPDAVTRLLEQSQGEDAALECPVCMDPIPNATIFLPCGHNACSECFAKITDPQQLIANGDETGGREGEAKCPNCRGRITASKTIDHNTFKKVYMEQSEEGDDERGALSEDGSDESSTDDDSEDSDTDSLRGFIDDEDDEESKYHKGANPFEKSSKKSVKLKKGDKAPTHKGKGKAKAGEGKDSKPPKKTLAQLKKESSSSAKARRRYLKKLRKDWETSAKIEKTMEILRQVQENPNPETKRPEKIIIFSQFTSLLDLLQIPISDAGFNYERYDGSMSSNARNQAVENFTENKDVQLMLISLKAGNAGLNLTAASQVIIFDPFWNPYIEEQAIDRAHRIGQQFPVHVHRILVKGTVEDRILALQEKKREMIESALDEGEARRISRLGVRDLEFLFNGSGD